MTLDTILYSQDDFQHDISTLGKMLQSETFDLIIGVNRGGCIPAVCLSHRLKIPTTMMDFSTRDGVNISPDNLLDYFDRISAQYKKILIVDDLVDSGVSLGRLVSVAKSYCDVSAAVLLHNIDVDIGVPVYSGTKFSRKDEPRYFDFWWEVIS